MWYGWNSICDFALRFRLRKVKFYITDILVKGRNNKGIQVIQLECEGFWAQRTVWYKSETKL